MGLARKRECTCRAPNNGEESSPSTVKTFEAKSDGKTKFKFSLDRQTASIVPKLSSELKF